MYQCEFCGKEYHKQGIKYHSKYCEKNPNKQQLPQKTDAFYEAMKKRRGNAKNGYSYVDWSAVPFEELGSYKRRESLFREANHCCTQCGYNKTREDGRSILEIDHIDGDHTNNTKENLRVLCPNCHAMTPNFKNWGRTSKHKTSKRLRKGNKGFEPSH